jgi:intracellular sulfur oxidation DsrE/DsrF family protein
VKYSRTAFLGTTSAVALAASIAAPVAGAANAGNPTQGLPYADFIARARVPFLHRQMFASTRPNGNVFVFMRNSLNGYQFGWSEGPRTLHAVAVFNGLGVAQGVGDAGWQRYRLRDVLTHEGLTVAATPTGNPWLHAPANLAKDDTSQASAFNQDVSIETLAKRGSEFFVCDTAMISLSQAIVRAGVAADADAVHADLRGLLAAEATLVPAGVSAMDALQAEHFTFFDANV